MKLQALSMDPLAPRRERGRDMQDGWVGGKLTF